MISSLPPLPRAYLTSQTLIKKLLPQISKLFFTKKVIVSIYQPFVKKAIKYPPMCFSSPLRGLLKKIPKNDPPSKKILENWIVYQEWIFKGNLQKKDTPLKMALKQENLLLAIDLLSQGATLPKGWGLKKKTAIILAFLLIEKNAESFLREADSFGFSCPDGWKALAKHHGHYQIPLPERKEKILSMSLLELASLSLAWYGAYLSISQEFDLNENERFCFAYQLANKDPKTLYSHLPLFQLTQKQLCELFMPLIKKDPIAFSQSIACINCLRAESLRYKLALELADLVPTLYIQNQNRFAIHDPQNIKMIWQSILRASPQTPLNAHSSLLYQALYLSQIWGLEGRGSLKVEENQEIQFSYSHWEFGNEFLLHMFVKSLYYFKDSLGSHFTKEISSIIPLLKNTATKEEAYTFLREGVPFVFLSGFRGHAISFTFIHQKIFLGNRGYRGKLPPGIICYRLPKYQKELDILLDLIEQGDKPVDEFERTFNALRLQRLSHYPMKDQKVGNCAIISIKTAFYTLLCELHSKENANHLYKMFTSYERMRTLMTYSPQKSDGMWQQIQRKASKNLALFKKWHNKPVTSHFFEKTSFEGFLLQLREIKQSLSPYFSQNTLFTEILTLVK